MRCNYCGSNYGDLPDVATDLWKHGCYECGATSFENKPQALVSARQSAEVFIPQITSGSWYGTFSGIVNPEYVLTGCKTISFAEARGNEVYRAITGGSTGYSNGEFFDFSGFHISEVEYTQEELKHYPDYPNCHSGWGELPPYVHELATTARRVTALSHGPHYDPPRPRSSKNFLQRLFSGE